MKITGITTRLVRVDPAAWYDGAEVPRAERTAWLFPLAAIHTDEGIDGYVTGTATNGEGRLQAHALHDVYFPGLEGADPLDRTGVWRIARDTTRHVYPLADGVVGLIDVAIWDIAGKALGAPLAGLLGDPAPSMPTYATGSHWNREPSDTFDEVRDAIDRGHRGYKLTLGRGLGADEPFLRAAGEAVGAGFRLMLDGVGRYEYEEALRVGRVLDELRFHWFEEPIPDRATRLLRQLSEQLQTPLLTGETLRLDEAMEAIGGDAAPRLRGDVQLKAGVTGLVQLVTAAAARGLPLELHACSSPLLDVANLHVGCATGCCELFESHHAIFRFGLLGDPLRPDAHGVVHLPSGNGLGVALDWDWIDANTIELLRSGKG